MVNVYRFAAVRPAPGEASSIAAVPYDVVTAEEARTIIKANPESFLTVSRSDAELPDIPPDDNRVYERARDNFQAYLENGRLKKDGRPAMYVYRILQENDTFIGLCCCLDTEDYRSNRIRRHELTRYDKEEDRTRHIDAIKAHDGPVVLLYRDHDLLFSFIESQISEKKIPDAEVHTSHGGTHQIFEITDPVALDTIEHRFQDIENLYIADGHHRAKAAINLVDRIRDSGLPAEGEISRFMGVLFAHNRVKIHGYSRLLADIGTFDTETFLNGLTEYFKVTPYGDVDGNGYNIQPRIACPEKYHVMHLYLQKKWYECTRLIDPAASLLEVLDVAVLQELVFKKMFGITDPRGDARLQYLGGARPVADLERLVDNGTYRLAFAMQPVRVGTVLSIADAGGVMPPKSTWFEPKLLSGLVIHSFS
ncbi:MAG: DUF1015 family protein [Methanoregula sp.]|uniref:DUF1015 domain-containing protein n=1 Tax=Methanoregula sp. TaxID=2052170 RepID=UPI003BAFA701